MATVWIKFLNYLLAFGKWCWANKWTVLFLVTTIVFLSMYGCKRNQLIDCKEDLKTMTNNYNTCSSNYEVVVDTNAGMELAYESCINEIDIIEKSYEKSKNYNTIYEKEIIRIHEIVKDLDEEKDAKKRFDLKKRIIESLYKPNVLNNNGDDSGK